MASKRRKLFNYKVAEYILIKVAALGMLAFIMSIYVLIANGFDLYNTSEFISNLKLWLYVGGFTLFITMLIDFIQHKRRKFTTKTVFFLHIFAGFIVLLLIMGLNIFAYLASLVGALCAFIYALGSYFFNKNKKFIWIAILVFPLIIFMSLMDFTVKTNWKEKTTENTYYTSFDYFNGEHQIPLSLEKKDRVISYVTIINENGGGHWFHVTDEDGELVEMIDLGSTRDEYEKVDTRGFLFRAKETGVYRIVVKGDELEGEIEMEWRIN